VNDSAQYPIVVEDLRMTFGSREILRGVTLRVRQGEVYVLMGPSGCGKTTVLRCMVGLQRPTAGTVRLLGSNLVELDEDQLDQFRGQIGMLFQFGALLNSVSVGDNVGLPLKERSKLDPATIHAIVKLKLSMVGLEGTHRNMPSELSGGMKKRAGLARAMALDPRLYFFDEPTSGLDPVTAAEFDELVATLKRALGMTAVVVTHDLDSAFRIADRIGVLFHGRLIAEGTPEEIRSLNDARIRSFVNREPRGGQANEQVWAKFFVEGNAT
jgi:phospholipid/cholesterol/gamma-HCH transport system ATP-binding protein